MYVFIVNMILVLWALHMFGQSLSSSRIHMDALKNSTLDFKKYIWLSLVLGFTSSSWKNEFLIQSRLWRAQIWDYRRFLFSQAQILFGFLSLFVCLGLFLEVSSYALLVFALIFASFGVVPKIRLYFGANTFSALVYLGLALFFLETGFKNSGLLMQALLDSELVFVTTIDSLNNLFLVLCISIFVGVFAPVQGWSVVLSFLLYVNSQMSFLSLAFMVVGELLGTVFYLIYRSRNWTEYYKKRVRGFFATVIGYLVLFLCGAVVFRYFYTFGAAYNQLTMLKWIHIGTLFLLFAGLYISVMTWGHFKVAQQERDIPISDAGLVNELEQSKDDLWAQFIVLQFKLRGQKLSQFKTELGRDPQSRGKIPPFVLNQFEAELNIIDKVVSKS